MTKYLLLTALLLGGCSDNFEMHPEPSPTVTPTKAEAKFLATLREMTEVMALTRTVTVTYHKPVTRAEYEALLKRVKTLEATVPTTPGIVKAVCMSATNPPFEIPCPGAKP